jgi:DNA-binding transcriptional MocR family regulator
MSEKGDSCFPSTRLLAEETGLSRRSVEKHLRTAVESGWLERSEVERRRDGTYKPIEYKAAIPGERASPGPGEAASHGPGESDDIDQGKEVPHRSSTREGDRETPTDSSLPSVGTSSERRLEEAGHLAVSEPVGAEALETGADDGAPASDDARAGN